MVAATAVLDSPGRGWQQPHIVTRSTYWTARTIACSSRTWCQDRRLGRPGPWLAAARAFGSQQVAVGSDRPINTLSSLICRPSTHTPSEWHTEA